MSMELILGKLVGHDELLDEMNSTLEKLTERVLETSDEVGFIKENMTTRTDIRTVMNGQDQMIVLLQRIEAERHATIEWIRQLEKTLEAQQLKNAEHDQAIEQIKFQVGVA